MIPLEIDLERLINENEFNYAQMDNLSMIIDGVEDDIAMTINKINETRKQNDFTYYCRYGRFPNEQVE